MYMYMLINYSVRGSEWGYIMFKNDAFLRKNGWYELELDSELIRILSVCTAGFKFCHFFVI